MKRSALIKEDKEISLDRYYIYYRKKVVSSVSPLTPLTDSV